MAKFDQSISEVHRLFVKAEKKLKKFERLDGDLLIPSVNELRYAGYHLVQYLACAKKSDKEDHLRSAEKHCKRSIYDTLEISIVFRLKQIEKFKDDYRLVSISNVINGYIDKVREINEIKEKISSIEVENKENYYEIIEKDFDKLEDIFLIFEAARDELNKSIKKNRRNLIIVIITIILAIVGPLKICNNNPLTKTTDKKEITTDPQKSNEE